MSFQDTSFLLYVISVFHDTVNAGKTSGEMYVHLSSFQGHNIMVVEPLTVLPSKEPCQHLRVPGGSKGGCKGTENTSHLTHWGRVTHICVGKLTNLSSDNGLSPGRRQAIIRTNVGILLIGPLGTNFSENLIIIQTFSFKKMHLKMSSAKWRQFSLGLNVLTRLCNVYNISYITCTWICCSLFCRYQLIVFYGIYGQISSISRTNFQNLNCSHLLLHLTLPNPLKPGFQSRMKM